MNREKYFNYINKLFQIKLIKIQKVFQTQKKISNIHYFRNTIIFTDTVYVLNKKIFPTLLFEIHLFEILPKSMQLR